MKICPTASASIAAVLLQLIPLSAAEPADMGVVGNHLSRMLQNMHFERVPFAEMGPRFLDEFLTDLDPERVFFVQSDIAWIQREYGSETPQLLLTGQAPMMAGKIHRIYRERVAARVAETKRLLETEKFVFTQNETIQRDRDNARWPKTEPEAMAYWRLLVKEAVLAETLSRETLAARAKEQGKPDPTATDKTIAEKIALRHDRLLRGVTEDVDAREISARFLSAVARAFDPHSDYLATSEMGRYREDLRNEPVGIGAKFSSEEAGTTRITAIIEGGPADRQGRLKPNDTILAVDTDGAAGPKPMVDVLFMDSGQIVNLIRGDEGSKVMIKVAPSDAVPGGTDLIEIVRGKVEIKDSLARASLIRTQGARGEPATLGIITLPSFYVDFDGVKSGCSADVAILLGRLNREKIDGLVLDLRQNGGGSLPEVRTMMGLFMGGGPVAQVKDKLQRIEVLESGAQEPAYTGPMVVLTDKSSASASEILAGALQDANRAVIVGQSSTFGKGTVQKFFDIAPAMPLFAAKGETGTLKLTIQKFYRPSGSSTQNTGVIPDIILPNANDAYPFGEAFLKGALKHDFIGPARSLKPLDRELLFVSRLQELSAARVKSSQDFADLALETQRVGKRIGENKISLNAAERRKELMENEDLRKQRDSERKVRFSALQMQDRNSMEFYDLSLEEVAANMPLKKTDPSNLKNEPVRTAGGDSTNSTITPAWPSGLDLQKRESLMVLRDMIDLERATRTAAIR